CDAAGGRATPAPRARPSPPRGDRIAAAPASMGRHTMAAAWDLGSVGATPATRYAMRATDDVNSIRYFANALVAWWRRNGATIEDVLVKAAHEREALEADTARFD